MNVRNTSENPVYDCIISWAQPLAADERPRSPWRLLFEQDRRFLGIECPLKQVPLPNSAAKINQSGALSCGFDPLGYDL